MRLRITIEFDVTDIDEKPIDDMGTLLELGSDTAKDVRNRLFGQGFLPADMLVGDYTVTPEVIT